VPRSRPPPLQASAARVRAPAAPGAVHDHGATLSHSAPVVHGLAGKRLHARRAPLRQASTNPRSGITCAGCQS